MRLICLRFFLLAAAFAGTISAQISSVDASNRAHLIARWDEELLREWGAQRPWLRLRGLPNPSLPENTEAVALERAAAARLTGFGFRLVPFLSWPQSSWSSGTRPGWGPRLPLDLREAYRRGFTYGESYAGSRLIFEIENEPDIDFVSDNPEVYAAFLKAVRLGLHHGAKAAGEAPPAVAMAPLALPPGPYLEALVANGLFSHTHFYNYHFYGHPEDFGGMHRQHAAAVRELGARPPVGKPVAKRHLPVMITEYGYPWLLENMAGTREGRVQQWRWFNEVASQMRAARVAAPMAFYLSPYREAFARDNFREFGLTVRPAAEAAGDRPAYTAGGVTYRPEDFGLRRPAPWMSDIGRKFSTTEASPALAWLLDQGRRPYRPRDWPVRAGPASPVVLDFVAGDSLRQEKPSRGYAATAVDSGVHRGEGELMLYNFDRQPITGRLHIVQGRDLLANVGAFEGRVWTLPPMGREPVALRLAVPATHRARHDLVIHFEPEGGPEVPPAILATAILPDATVMPEERAWDFAPDGRSTSANARLIDRRMRAAAEPPLSVAGRWRVTEGLRVEETGNRIWRFHVGALPAQPTRPAMAELPLPDDFTLPDGFLLRFGYRMVQPVDYPYFFEVYFRTATGNLFQVWPRQYAMTPWQEYSGAKEDFSMAFYGRKALPWRFSGHRPVALVFHFRPAPVALPAIYELRDPRLVTLGER